MRDQLILASQSPRRAQLLQDILIKFRIEPAHIDESVHDAEPAEQYVQRMARKKADYIQPRQLPVLAADTIVVFEGAIFGKPVNQTQAIKMLSQLSGNTHVVLTALCVIHGTAVYTHLSKSRVRFRKLSQDEIARYWLTGEPCDKAGAYGIQGIGGTFVESIQGSQSSIMGLPLCETEQLLRQTGIDTWKHRV